MAGGSDALHDCAIHQMSYCRLSIYHLDCLTKFDWPQINEELSEYLIGETAGYDGNVPHVYIDLGRAHS